MPSIKIPSDGEGVRLDRYLRRIGFYFPQNLFEKWGRQGKLRLNDKKIKASERVREGDTITFPDDAVPLPPPLDVTPLLLTPKEAEDSLKSMTLFEDDNLLILNKPIGLATQGGTGQRTSVDDILKAHSPGSRWRLTHRIDKETSGLLLIAKTPTTATALTNAFRSRTIEKTYVALCKGIFDHQQGVIDKPIGRCDQKLEKMRTSAQEAKEAVTYFEVMRTYSNTTLVRLTPKTGRTHQLRVHMSEEGHPIVGDKKYGGPAHPRLMLHAWKITFSLYDKHYTFKAPLPQGFEE